MHDLEFCYGSFPKRKDSKIRTRTGETLIQVPLRAVPPPSNKQRRLTVSDQNYAKNAGGRRIKQELERLYFLYLSPSSLWEAVGFLF